MRLCAPPLAATSRQVELISLERHFARLRLAAVTASAEADKAGEVEASAEGRRLLVTEFRNRKGKALRAATISSFYCKKISPRCQRSGAPGVCLQWLSSASFAPNNPKAKIFRALARDGPHKFDFTFDVTQSRGKKVV